MGAAKAKKKPKPKTQQPNLTARGRANRDRVGIGNLDATEERLRHAEREASVDHLLNPQVTDEIEKAEEAKRPRIRIEKKREAEEEGVPINPQGVRHVADPFDLLRKRSLLDIGDPHMNQALWFAGDRYRHYWKQSGLSGVSAMDMSRDVVDGGRGPKGPSDVQEVLDARERLREGNAEIGPRHATLFCAVILRGQTIADQRYLVRESGNERTADAISLERLRECLHRLCKVWKITPPRSQKISSSIGEENMRRFENRG